jgi:hypothetical protein
MVMALQFSRAQETAEQKKAYCATVYYLCVPCTETAVTYTIRPVSITKCRKSLWQKKRIYGLCQGLLLYTTFESLPAGIQVSVNVRVKYSLSMPYRHKWGVGI